MIEDCSAPKNWNDLNDLLWKKSHDPETQKYRPYTAFRGLPKQYDKPLQSGIQRMLRPENTRHVDLATIERRLVDTFRNYSQEHHPELKSDWEVLSLARHYRLHTRLIDWTISPFVALFFATEKHLDEDGVIWCVDRKKTRDLLPDDLREFLIEKGTFLFNTRLLDEKFKDLSDFDTRMNDTMIWFEPASISPRIVNQYAIFSVMPGVESSQEDYLEKSSGLAVWRIPVPKDLKREVSQRLEVMNLSHRHSILDWRESPCG